MGHSVDRSRRAERQGARWQYKEKRRSRLVAQRRVAAVLMQNHARHRERGKWQNRNKYVGSGERLGRSRVK
eukprot:5214464-Pleurochrysis_carterae.AAC.2